MKFVVSLGVVLMGIWLLWSGHYTPLLIGLGALSCTAVLAIVRAMRLGDRETAPVDLALGATLYAPWLAWQVVKANIDVALRILRPGPPIAPRIVRIRASQRGEVARAMYANSITLTPGTVSVDTDGDRITVHALTAEAERELLSGEMDRRVQRAESRR